MSKQSDALMKLIHPHGGYGLGYELFVWAKGYILSPESGARLLHPAWGNNIPAITGAICEHFGRRAQN